MSKSITSLPAVLAFSLCSLSVQAQPHGPAPNILRCPPAPVLPGSTLWKARCRGCLSIPMEKSTGCA